MTTATFETDTDKLRAFAFALLLHVFAVGALFIGLLLQREQPPVAAAEGEIEATLITSPQAASAASKAVQAAEQATPPQPQPIPEPSPQTAHIAPQPKPQQALDQPDTVDQQRVSALAQQSAVQEKKEQEEKHRQEQVLLQQQAQVDVENKQRLAAQLDAIHREQAKIAQQIKLAEEKRKQLHDQAVQQDASVPAPIGPERPQVGNKGDDLASLRARYIAAMNQTANSNWDPVGVPRGVRCRISFRQLPGGDVFGEIVYLNCPFDAVARETIERAMRKQPMPYTEFVKVFDPNPSVTFCNPPEACSK